MKDVNILVEALPYIKQFHENLHVLKDKIQIFVDIIIYFF